MTTFEIYLNGRKKCTAGLRSAGVILSALTWARGVPKQKTKEDLEFRVSGVMSRTQTHVDWWASALTAGDEIKIVVVDGSKADRPKTKRSESKALRAKRERDYVARKAAEFGWKIMK